MKFARMFNFLIFIALATNCGQGKFKSDVGNRDNIGSTGPTDANAFGKNPIDISKLPENASTLSSGGPTAGTSNLAERPLDLDCEKSSEQTLTASASASADIKFANNSRVVMNVKGRFCPTVSDNLTVVFIIDFSGSMGPNKPDIGSSSFQPASGNDPRTSVGASKSCGRLQAVEAIMAKFKAGDNVNISAVTFASDIIESHSIPPIEAATFKADRLGEANKLRNFCSYVAPNATFASEEMALPNAGVGPATNYQAAFNRAYDYLKNVSGRKAVYFITDGRPTVATNLDPFEAGKAAATKLKTIENLYFNAFFLQYKQSGLQEDKQGFDNLVQTIGAPERVVRVDSAAQLAIEVSKEQAGTFDAKEIKASLSVLPYQTEGELKLLNFNPDPKNPKAWHLETEPFVLLGSGQKVYTHAVTISAKAKDGTIHSSHINILYQQDSP